MLSLGIGPNFVAGPVLVPMLKAGGVGWGGRG